ncbi:hypothetical protein DVH24_027527, partial [Malus domestica]
KWQFRPRWPLLFDFSAVSFSTFHFASLSLSRHFLQLLLFFCLARVHVLVIAESKAVERRGKQWKKLICFHSLISKGASPLFTGLGFSQWRLLYPAFPDLLHRGNSFCAFFHPVETTLFRLSGSCDFVIIFHGISYVQASLCAVYRVLVIEALATYVGQVVVPSLIALFVAATTAMLAGKLRVPVDPLECLISQDIANSIVVWLANTLGAAELEHHCLQKPYVLKRSSH